MKIGLMGAHCSGKTTLARELILKLQPKYSKLGYVSSVARRCQIKEPIEHKQNWIIVSRIQEEIEISQESDCTICERTVLDDYSYYAQACIRNKCGDGSFITMQKHIVNRWLRTYDKLFLLEPLPLVSDGVRPTDAEEQQELYILMVNFLNENNIDYEIVPKMELDKRVEFVMKRL